MAGGPQLQLQIDISQNPRQPAVHLGKDNTRSHQQLIVPHHVQKYDKANFLLHSSSGNTLSGSEGQTLNPVALANASHESMQMIEENSFTGDLSHLNHMSISNEPSASRHPQDEE
jgi:hypothetical protein